MKRKSNVDFKLVFIITTIILGFGIFITITKTLINTENQKELSENVKQTRVLTDKETLEKFSQYKKIYNKNIRLINEGIGGNVSEKVYNNTKNCVVLMDIDRMK